MQRAVAGELEIPLFGETVMLNAGNSFDPNGDGVAYEWSRVDLVLDDAPHARAIPSVPSVQHEPGTAGFQATTAGTYSVPGAWSRTDRTQSGIP